MAATPAAVCNIPVRRRTGAQNWQDVSIRLPQLSVALILAFRPKLSSIRGSVIYSSFELRET